MNLTKNKSFVVRLRKGQDLITYLNGFVDYNPPRLLETPPEMTALLASMNLAKDTEAARLENYRNATAARANAFRTGIGNIDSVITSIRQAVIAQFGVNSPEVKSINTIIRKIRATAGVKPPADPAAPEAATRTRRSEHSYAAIEGYFNDLLITLGQLNNYSPAKDALKIPALQVIGANLTALSDAVANSVKALKSAREARDLTFIDFNERVLRIKAYVKAQYGTKSEETRLIQGLGI
jgi:hypothetical protein